MEKFPRIWKMVELSVWYQEWRCLHLIWAMVEIHHSIHCCHRPMQFIMEAKQNKRKKLVEHVMNVIKRSEIKKSRKFRSSSSYAMRSHLILSLHFEAITECTEQVHLVDELKLRRIQTASFWHPNGHSMSADELCCLRPMPTTYSHSHTDARRLYLLIVAHFIAPAVSLFRTFCQHNATALFVVAIFRTAQSTPIHLPRHIYYSMINL